MKRRKVIGTRNRGKTRIFSRRQQRFLEVRGLPYTAITKKGKKKRRNVR